MISIHPRNSIHGDGIKRNTCKPHKGGGKLAAKMAKLNRRRLAHSATLEDLKRSNSRSNPAGFRAPGSMNQHKCAARGRRS